MSGLSQEQLENLLKLVASSEADSYDCDGCYEHLASFAEAQLSSQELPAALRAVETHLQQCPCCKDEFNALLEGLRAIDGDSFDAE